MDCAALALDGKTQQPHLSAMVSDDGEGPPSEVSSEDTEDEGVWGKERFFTEYYSIEFE